MKTSGQTPFPDADAARKQLRADAIARRNAENVATIDRWNAALCAELRRHWPTAPGRVIGFCWPVRNEPDLRRLVADWQTGRSADIEVALPVVVGTAQPLAFRAWREWDAMVTDRYGIPTPAAGEWVQPDVLLIPLNAFDARGYRIGYGGGFFDRTLAALQPRPLAIGVGFEIGRVADTWPQPHDMRLDWIATEAGVWPV